MLIYFYLIQFFIYLILLSIKLGCVKALGFEKLAGEVFRIGFLTCLPAAVLLVYGEYLSYILHIKALCNCVNPFSSYAITLVMILIDGFYLKNKFKEENFPFFKISFVANTIYWFLLVCVWGVLTGALLW